MPRWSCSWNPFTACSLLPISLCSILTPTLSEYHFVRFHTYHTVKAFLHNTRLIPRVLDLLFTYAGGIPLLFMVLWAIFLRPDGHKAHVTILGLFITLILSSFLTDIVKNSVGRPRPDLIARCKPAKGTTGQGLVTIDVCTQTDHHVLHDGWRSFPSGHSSFALSGLGYLAL